MKTYYYILLLNTCFTLFSFAQNSEIINDENALIEVLQTLHSHPENIHKVHTYIQEYSYTITQHTYIESLLQKELKKLTLIKNTPANTTPYPLLFQKYITLALIHGFCIFMVLPHTHEYPQKGDECFADVFFEVNRMICTLSLGSLVELYIRAEYENRSITQCIEIIKHILTTL